MVNLIAGWNKRRFILGPANPFYSTFVASHTCTSIPGATKILTTPAVLKYWRGYFKRSVLVLIFSAVSAMSFANRDTILITALLNDIAAMQVERDDGEFYAGMFYGYRECGGIPHNKQRDNNIFFTALTAFSLKNMLPYLNPGNEALAKNIVSRAAATYPNFKNRFGNPFYNFWPTYAPIICNSYVYRLYQ